MIKRLVDQIAISFQTKVEEKLKKRLKSFYVVGSYAFDKISVQRPDINFLLIFDKYTLPQDYLIVGDICKEVEEGFSKKATIKIEFRPFRYIKPRYKKDVEVSINPIIISTGEISVMGGVIFNKWFTEGLKSTNKLLFGDDHLKTLKVGSINKKDLMKAAMFDLAFFTIPLSRSPAQYSKAESNLLLNESLVNAKNISFIGVEAAMTDEELKDKKFVDIIENKNRMISFYKNRYGVEVSKMIEKILWTRKNYLKVKNDPRKAEEMFSIALRLANLVRKKVLAD